MENSPIRPTDDDARALARKLMTASTYASLAVLDPDTGHPFVSRIAFAVAHDNSPYSLISTLSFHTQALQKNPNCSLLIGEPPVKGDPLAFARLTLSAEAKFVPQKGRAAFREPFLKTHPKAALYVDFGDFHFVQFTVQSGALNGGFGQAFALTAADLA